MLDELITWDGVLANPGLLCAWIIFIAVVICIISLVVIKPPRKPKD